MKIVLLKDVANVGVAGEAKDVRPGFARNFLIPQNLAVLPNDPQIKELTQRRNQKLKESKAKEDKLRATLNDLAGKKFIFKVKTDAKGKLYGSVGPKEIAQKTGLDEELIKTHYKKLGQYKLPIKIDSQETEVLIEIQKE